MEVPLALLMECRYCHKKFSSFRFWKNSEFCSEEHADAYRSDTLSRLMDNGGDSGTSSPAFEDALRGAGESHEIVPSEYKGARRLEPPQTSASALEGGDGYSLPPAGTHALEADLRMGDLTSQAGSSPLHTPSDGDVDLQTPEEALNALRALAGSADRSRLRSPEPLRIEEEPPRIEEQLDDLSWAAESTDQVDGVDADDVFAELRRMAAVSGQSELENQEDDSEEDLHLPMSPEGVSAFDRLMETPAPSAGVGGPRLDRRLQLEQQADEPVPVSEALAEGIVEQDTRADVDAIHDEVPASAASAEVTFESRDEALPTSKEPAAQVSVEEEVATDEEDEKVVSFPSPQQASGRDNNGRRSGLMMRTRGAAPGLFDSGIHEEFLSVGLSDLMRQSPELPVGSVAVVLDEVLKAPAPAFGDAPMLDLAPQGSIGTEWPIATDVLTVLPTVSMAMPRPTSVSSSSAKWTPTRANVAPMALVFVVPPGVFSPVGDVDGLLATISLRDLKGSAAFAVERSCEPYASPIEPYLPVGLAQSMGVVPPNRGQLIRSELFAKEPEARECAVEHLDATPETDVRRAYYGRQGTA